MQARTVEIRKSRGSGFRVDQDIPKGTLFAFAGETRSVVKIAIIPEPTPLVGLDETEVNASKYSED